MLLRPLLRPVLREPLRSPFTRRGGFSVRSLFSAGEQGAWYDPSDFSTMWQDSAGTTPVTAVGQPVGKILDKSGRGNHLIQATTTSRPLLQQDGSGFYYLSFDGVDDSLASAATINLSGTDKATLFAGVYKASDAGTQVMLEFGSNTAAGVLGSMLFYLNTPSTTKLTVSQSVLDDSAFATAAAPIANVFTGSVDFAQASPNEVTARINGSSVASAGSGDSGTGNFGNNTLYVGRRNNASFPFNGRLYQLILRGAASTAAQIASGERFVGGRMGIAL